jgi:hypothetical protein
MPSEYTLGSLEIIFGAGVVALAVVTTISTVVWTFAFLVTREKAHVAAPARPTVVPATPAVRERHEAEAPAGVAG